MSAQGLGNLARMEQMLASGGQGESTTNGHHGELTQIYLHIFSEIIN